jgi:hypothetical protein
MSIFLNSIQRTSHGYISSRRLDVQLLQLAVLHRLLAPSPHDQLPYMLVCLLELRLAQLFYNFDRCIFLAEVDALDLLVHAHGGIADDADGAGGGLADEIADALAEAYNIG